MRQPAPGKIEGNMMLMGQMCTYTGTCVKGACTAKAPSPKQDGGGGKYPFVGGVWATGARGADSRSCANFNGWPSIFYVAQCGGNLIVTSDTGYVVSLQFFHGWIKSLHQVCTRVFLQFYQQLLCPLVSLRESIPQLSEFRVFDASVRLCTGVTDGSASCITTILF